MKYSKYANEYLVRLYKEYLAYLDKGEAREDDYEMKLAKKLLDSDNDDYMEPVWKALHKREADKELIGEWYLDACLKAFTWGNSKKQTQSEKKKELLAISKKSRKLADLIGEYTQISAISKSAVFSVLNELLNPDWGRIGYAKFARPEMRKMLLRFADKLDVESEIPPEIAKPNTDNAHHRVFVRRLTISMREQFDQPLVATVANTASAIFGKKIDENFVRNNTRDLVPDCNVGSTK